MTRLLIVDDETLVTDTISAYLSTRLPDVEILTAASSFKAMEYLNKMPFEVVITDIRMPQMSGIELLQQIKRLWPACYVIVLTAYDEFQYAYETLKYDNVSFLLKIEEPETILETVRRAIKCSEDALIARQQEERVREYEHFRTVLQQSLFDRVFRYGGVLPSKGECESISLPLEPGRETLMAIAMLPDPDPASLTLHRLQFSVEKLFEKRNISAACYLLPNRILFMFQSEQTDKRELMDFFFGQINQLVDAWDSDGLAPSFVCLDRPIPWDSIKTGFSVLEENCNRQRSDGSVVQVGFQQQKNGYPTVADMIQLKEYLVFRQTDSFMRSLSSGIYRVPSDQRDLRASVLAVRVLLSESFDRFGQVLEEQPDFYPLLDFGVPHDTQTWLEGIRRLLAALIAHEKTDELSEESTVISSILTYVENHLSEPLTLSLIAEALHYNSSYLSRLFKQSMGIGLIRHITSMRIERAAEKLAETNERIDDIAEECGFQSAKYFSIVFRNEKGCSPSTWRQNHRK